MGNASGSSSSSTPPPSLSTDDPPSAFSEVKEKCPRLNDRLNSERSTSSFMEDVANAPRICVDPVALRLFLKGISHEIDSKSFDELRRVVDGTLTSGTLAEHYEVFVTQQVEASTRSSEEVKNELQTMVLEELENAVIRSHHRASVEGRSVATSSTSHSNVSLSSTNSSSMGEQSESIETDAAPPLEGSGASMPRSVTPTIRSTTSGGSSSANFSKKTTHSSDGTNTPRGDATKATRAAKNWRMAKALVMSVVAFKMASKRKDAAEVKESAILTAASASKDDVETGSSAIPRLARDASSRWRTLRGLVRATSAFRAFADIEVVRKLSEGLSGLDDLCGVDEDDDDFDQDAVIPHPRRAKLTAQEEMSEKELAREMKVWSQTLERHRRECRWIDLAKRGGVDEIDEMARLLQKDPAELQRYAAWDPRRLVNCVDDRNRTALFYAAYHGNVGLMTWLLDLCADPRICAETHRESERPTVDENGQSSRKLRTHDYESPIEVAARWGHVGILNMLLDLHPDSSAKDKKGLHKSLSEGSLDSLKNPTPKVGFSRKHSLRRPRYSSGLSSSVNDVPDLTYIYCKADLKAAMSAAKGAGQRAAYDRLRRYVKTHKMRPSLKWLSRAFSSKAKGGSFNGKTITREAHGLSVYAGGSTSKASPSGAKTSFSFDPHQMAANSLRNSARNARR